MVVSKISKNFFMRSIIPTITLEQQLWSQGFINVAGVDEAGRGPLAGPVTAGAVMIHKPEQVVEIVRDSKYMTAKQRDEAFSRIQELSSAWGVGIVSAQEIDELGINWAVKKAMEQALINLEKNFTLKLNYVIIDGIRTIPLDNFSSQKIKAGGLYHYSISAGSVLAKVTRDRLMMQYAEKFPEYGFAEHVGYGTKKHLEAIEKFGICELHRKTFKPIAQCI